MFGEQNDKNELNFPDLIMRCLNSRKSWEGEVWKIASKLRSPKTIWTPKSSKSGTKVDKNDKTPIAMTDNESNDNDSFQSFEPEPSSSESIVEPTVSTPSTTRRSARRPTRLEPNKKIMTKKL